MDIETPAIEEDCDAPHAEPIIEELEEEWAALGCDCGWG